MRAIQDKPCSKPGCHSFGQRGVNIVGHGWFTTKSGRRRRYRCKICGGTASMNTGTAYSGLRCTRREFDQVASLRVERRVKISTARRLKDALLESEDSENLNTSFVERLNLTMRQGSAYLRRRSPCHARCEDQLREHVELLRCHYNFVRPHRALKFGRETRTPAMQAGLVSKRLTLSDIFTARGVSLRLFVLVVLVSVTVHLTEPRAAELRSSWQPDRRTAA